MARSGVDRWISSSSGRRVTVLLPLVLVLDLFLVLALGLLPLDSISGLRCDAFLRGGEPKPDLTLAPMIRASSKRLCSDAASGRRNLLLAVGVMVLLFGTGAVLTPADRLERALVRGGEDDDDDDDDRWDTEPSYVPSYSYAQSHADEPAGARPWVRSEEPKELPAGDGPLALTAGGGAEAGETAELTAGDELAEPAAEIEEAVEAPPEVDEAAARKAARAEKARQARARAKAARAPAAAVAKVSKPTRPAAKLVRARPSKAGQPKKAVVSARAGKSTKAVIARSARAERVVETTPEAVVDEEALVAMPGPVPVAEEAARATSTGPRVEEAAPVVAEVPVARRRPGPAAKRVGTRLGTRRPARRGVVPTSAAEATLEHDGVSPEASAPEPGLAREALEPEPGLSVEPLRPEPSLGVAPIELEPAGEPALSDVAPTEAVTLAPPGPGPEGEPPAEGADALPAPVPPGAPRATRAEREARAARAVRPVATTRSRVGRSRPPVVTTPFDVPADEPRDIEDELSEP